MSLTRSLLGVSSEIRKLKDSSNVSPTIKRDLEAIESKEDIRILKDKKIERFLELIMKRYYRFWFYIRGIPKIAIPMLITGSQRLLQNLYIKGCQTMEGKSEPLSSCISCNGESTIHTGNLYFRSLDYGIIIGGILILMIILRRGIAEAHLCVKVIKYRIFVRTSWYYWSHILLIVAVGLMCAVLSLISSIFLAQKNAEEAQIICQSGPLAGTKIQFILTDYFDNLIYWIMMYLVAVLSYWPVIDFLIDLYDTPFKIFIEPEDMFKFNGEMKGEEKLFQKFSVIEHKVRLKKLLEEISLVYRQINKMKPFRIEQIPDKLLEVAILRLYNKGKIKKFKQKIS